MIKINVLRSMADQRSFDAMQAAIAEFESGRVRKSFAARHPELGKMVNCQVCHTRHRNARVCVPVYTTTMKDADGVEQKCEERVLVPTTYKMFLGASQFKGKRIFKHRNKRSLQVLERATKIYREEKSYFPNIDKEEDDKLGKRCLSRAINELRKERAEKRRRSLKIINASRLINRVA
jgi:hypothetical protein